MQDNTLKMSNKKYQEFQCDIQDKQKGLENAISGGRPILLEYSPNIPGILGMMTSKGDITVWDSSYERVFEKSLDFQFNQACWDNSGNKFHFSTQDGKIGSFDFQKQETNLLFDLQTPIFYTMMHSSADVFIVGSNDGKVNFVDLRQEQPIGDLCIPQSPLFADLNCQNNVMAAIDGTFEQQNVCIFNIQKLFDDPYYLRFSLPGKGKASCLKLSKSGRRLAIGKNNGDILTRPFNVEQQVKNSQSYINCSSTGAMNLTSMHEGPITSLAWNPRKDFILASGGSDGCIVTYNTSAKRKMKQRKVATWPIQKLVYSPDGRDLVIAMSQSSTMGGQIMINPNQGPYIMVSQKFV